MKIHLTSIVLILLTSVVAAENEIRCGRPVSKHLIVSLTNEDRANSFARFYCSRNGILIGSASSTCEPSGLWSHPWPVCEIRCSVDNLDFTGLVRGPKSSFKDGEVFEIKCDPGYKEANSKQFRCDDGHWVGPIRPCVVGSCMKPIPEVENAKAEVSSKTHLSVVKYVCEKPYVLVETSQVQCLFSEWEGQPPKCEISQCFLKDLEHSEKVSAQTAEVTLSGNELNVRCEVGYHPITEIPLCVDGKWTRNLKPLCKISSCLKSPPAVDHATVVIPSTSHTSVLKYECKESYKLVGNSQIRCMYGEWRGKPPTCEDSRCYLKNLNRSDGMSVNTNSVTNTGEELKVLCIPGYDVNPVKPICLDGKWTKNSVPPCIEKAAANCIENPPSINHGRLIVSTRTHGSQVKYVCDDSYMQVGHSQVQCVQGVWKGPVPRCIDTRCYLKDLQRAQNIAPETPNITLPGDHLNVTCNEGYTTRPVIPICIRGKWNRNFISPCKEMICNKPPPKVINAKEEVVYNPIRTVVKYSCKEPYILEGASQIECQFGEWRGRLPKCVDKNCTEPPPNVIHASVTITLSPQNKLAKYVCNEPYFLVGDSEIRCLFGGWNGTAPTCKDSRCYLHDLQRVENLAEDTPIATNSGEKLNATCKAGYSPDEERPLCQNGTWVKNSISICKESTCSIPNVDHGDVLEEYKGEFYFNLTRLQYDRDVMHIKMPVGRMVSSGTNYMLLCHEGHVVQGKSVKKSAISCVAGKWLPEPVCVLDKTEKPEIERSTTPGKTDPEDDVTGDIQSTTLPTTVVPGITSKCSCKYVSKDENLIATAVGEQLKQYQRVRKGVEVVFRCLHVGFHRFHGLQELQCENCKDWNVTELPRCTEPEAGNTIILFDRKVNVSDEGHLEVWKGQPLELLCVGVESAMYPYWNAPNPEGVSITRRRANENSENIQYVSELKINSVKIEDEGSYDCAVEDNPDTTVQLFVIDPDVRCPEFPANEQIEVTYKNERHVRSKAYFSCVKNGAELIGKSAVRCLKNGEWSGPVPKCEEIKCRKLKETDLLNIYYTEDRNIGSFATFHCSTPGKRLGEPFAKCLENGLWSKRVPKCQRADDFEKPSSQKEETITKPTEPSIPAENGQACFCTYNYQTRLLAASVGGRKLESSSRVRRGDVVSFSCLYPNMHLKWPNGLRLLGPVNFTCNECENFKERELPTCEIRKLGINVFVFDDKMKILPDGVIGIPRGENIKIQCINSKAPPWWNTFERDGLIISSEFSRPTSEANGFFVSSIDIGDANEGHSGRYECIAPFGSVTPLDLKIYGEEEPSPATQLAITRPYGITSKATLPPPTVETPHGCSHCTYDYNSDLMLIATVRSRKIQPGELVKKGDVISLNCRYPGMIIQWQNGLEFSGEVNLTCKGCEKWKNRELPTCQLEQAGGSFIVYNNKMNVLPGGVIEIARGDSVEFRCINPWVQPMWDAGDREAIYFENDPIAISRKNGHFSAYMLIDEVGDDHAGTYRCFATDQITVYEGTKMDIKISNLGVTTPINAMTASTARPITTTPVAAATHPPDPPGKCYCTYNYDPQLLIATAKKHLEVGSRVAEDTIVSFSCQDPDMKLQWPNGMKFSGKVNLRCNACEKWKRSELPTCDFVNEEDSLLVYDDKMRILPNGNVEVPKGDSIEIRCVNSREQPQWQAGDRERIYFSSDSNDITQKTGLYSSYMLIDGVTEEHVGAYRCSNSENKHLTLHLQVSEDSELQCPELPLITEKGNFVIVYENGRNIHSVAQYKCADDSHVLIGSESRVCMEDEQWSGTPPTCTAPEIQCPNLPSRTRRGTFIITYENDRKLGSTAYYSCKDKTQKLIGGRKRTCLDDGKWSGGEPSCEDLTCPDLPLLDGLLVFYNNGNNKLRSKIQFRCPKDKTLVGNTSSVCQDDGTWSSAWPSCEDYVSCDRFENPLGLEVTYSDNRRVGSKATFRCLPPHDLVGSSFATCLDDGTWSEPLPFCEGDQVCRLSREVSPRLIIKPKRDFYRFGDFALLSCPPGMRLTDKIERVLCHGETWSDDFPDCIDAEVKR